MLGRQPLDNTVLMGLVHGHMLDGDNRFAHLFVQLNHLLAAGHLAHHQVIAEQNHEGFVTDHIARHPDGMPQAQRFFLPNGNDIDQVGDIDQFLQHLHPCFDP